MAGRWVRGEAPAPRKVPTLLPYVVDRMGNPGGLRRGWAGVPEGERPEPHLACRATTATTLVAEGAEHALSTGRHVVGNGHRGPGPQQPREVLLRPARLADRARGAGDGDPGRPGGLHLRRLPAGDRLPSPGLAAGERAAASDDALRLPGRGPRLGGRRRTRTGGHGG